MNIILFVSKIKVLRVLLWIEYATPISHIYLWDFLCSLRLSSLLRTLLHRSQGNPSPEWIVLFIYKKYDKIRVKHYSNRTYRKQNVHNNKAYFLIFINTIILQGKSFTTNSFSICKTNNLVFPIWTIYNVKSNVNR